MKKLTGLLSLAIISSGLAASLPAKATTYFRDDDRTVLRSYMTTTTDSNGDSTTTTTYYKPGTVLPDTIAYKELPSDVTVKLVQPPPGDEYVMIGDNAYLINRDKRVVIDSESLASR